MPSIIVYQKYITREITRELRLPEDAQHQRLGTELATLNGLTYVALPDGVVLPEDQPQEIAATITGITLDDTLRDEIKSASPHVRLINARVAEKIAERYSASDEIKLLRTAPSGEFDAYNAYAESCREWGRAQKAALGL